MPAAPPLHIVWRFGWLRRSSLRASARGSRGPSVEPTGALPMNHAHRYLEEQRSASMSKLRRPASAESKVREVISSSKAEMESHAFLFSPSPSPQPTRPRSAFSPVEHYVRELSSLELVLPSPTRRPQSASPQLMGAAQAVLHKRPSPSAYLSNGNPRRRPSSATPTSLRRRPGSASSTASLMTRSPAWSPAPSAARLAGEGSPGTDEDDVISTPRGGPPLLRTWSGGWSPARSPVPLAPPPATAKRVWSTKGGQYLADKEDYENAVAAETKRVAEESVQPRHMAPAQRRAHIAERARHNATLVHAYGSWHNHMTYSSGARCHRDSWLHVRQRENGVATGRRLGHPA